MRFHLSRKNGLDSRTHRRRRPLSHTHQCRESASGKNGKPKRVRVIGRGIDSRCPGRRLVREVYSFRKNGAKIPQSLSTPGTKSTELHLYAAHRWLVARSGLGVCGAFPMQRYPACMLRVVHFGCAVCVCVCVCVRVCVASELRH